MLLVTSNPRPGRRGLATSSIIARTMLAAAVSRESGSLGGPFQLLSDLVQWAMVPTYVTWEVVEQLLGMARDS